MKKITLVIGILLVLSACKKDSTCWECVESNGNNFGTYCDSKQVDELKSKGWTCSEK